MRMPAAPAYPAHSASTSRRLLAAVIILIATITLSSCSSHTKNAAPSPKAGFCQLLDQYSSGVLKASAVSHTTQAAAARLHEAANIATRASNAAPSTELHKALAGLAKRTNALASSTPSLRIALANANKTSSQAATPQLKAYALSTQAVFASRAVSIACPSLFHVASFSPAASHRAANATALAVARDAVALATSQHSAPTPAFIGAAIAATSGVSISVVKGEGLGQNHAKPTTVKFAVSTTPNQPNSVQYVCIVKPAIMNGTPAIAHC